MGAAAHAAHEPTAEYLRWDRPEAWPRVKLPPPVEEEIIAEGLAEPVAHYSQAPHVEGPHRRVVTYNTFARCVDCHGQTGKVKG
eukprot:5473835-Amphidinium_carterae.1